MPGPPTPAVVSGRRGAVRRLRAWTPQSPPPAGVTAGGSCRGRGREGGEGRPRPPPRGPQSLPGSWEDRTSPRQTDQETGGSGGRGRGVGPAWGGGGRRGASGLPARVRGPGVGGPEGCWRLWLSLSPSPGLSLSLWSHPEVPQRRCLTHCPPVARAAGGAGASGAPSPHLPFQGRGLQQLSRAAFVSKSPRSCLSRFPSFLPPSFLSLPPPHLRSSLPPPVSAAATGLCPSVPLFSVLSTLPGLSLHLPGFLFSMSSSVLPPPPPFLPLCISSSLISAPHVPASVCLSHHPTSHRPPLQSVVPSPSLCSL